MTESQKIEWLDIIREDGKLSIGRVSFIISFLIACFYWMILRIDAPSTLIAVLTIIMGYVLAGKGIKAATDYFNTPDAPVEQVNGK